MRAHTCLLLAAVLVECVLCEACWSSKATLHDAPHAHLTGLAGEGLAGVRRLADVDQGPASPLDQTLRKYWTHGEIEGWISDYLTRCGRIARQHAIGTSVGGKTIWAVEVSKDIDRADDMLKANFRYVGNVHGDEPLGRQILPALAEYLCMGGSKDLATEVDDLLEGVRLFLVPTANPDGFTQTGIWQRENSRGVDLNRNFPDWIREGIYPGNPREGSNPRLEITGTQQPETRALMNWAKEVRFLGSCTLHEGAMVANYPWDGRLDLRMESQYHASPEDSTFRMLASAYASMHTRMSASVEFRGTGGITNGSQWYPVYGGMQDWMYIVGDTYELTLEISESKHPPESYIRQVWEENRAAMVKYPLLVAYGGIYGRLREGDPEGGPARPATEAVVAIEGNPKLSRPGKQGQFFRPVVPGTYTVSFYSAWHETYSTTVTVEKGKPAFLDVTLVPCKGGGLCSGAMDGEQAIEASGWLSPWSTADANLNGGYGMEPPLTPSPKPATPVAADTPAGGGRFFDRTPPVVPVEPAAPQDGVWLRYSVVLVIVSGVAFVGHRMANRYVQGGASRGSSQSKSDDDRRGSEEP